MSYNAKFNNENRDTRTAESTGPGRPFATLQGEIATGLSDMLKKNLSNSMLYSIAEIMVSSNPPQNERLPGNTQAS